MLKAFTIVWDSVKRLTKFMVCLIQEMAVDLEMRRAFMRTLQIKYSISSGQLFFAPVIPQFCSLQSNRYLSSHEEPEGMIVGRIKNSSLSDQWTNKCKFLIYRMLLYQQQLITKVAMMGSVMLTNSLKTILYKRLEIWTQ